MEYSLEYCATVEVTTLDESESKPVDVSVCNSVDEPVSNSVDDLVCNSTDGDSFRMPVNEY